MAIPLHVTNRRAAAATGSPPLPGRGKLTCRGGRVATARGQWEGVHPNGASQAHPPLATGSPYARKSRSLAERGVPRGAHPPRGLAGCVQQRARGLPPTHLVGDRGRAPSGARCRRPRFKAPGVSPVPRGLRCQRAGPTFFGARQRRRRAVAGLVAFGGGVASGCPSSRVCAYAGCRLRSRRGRRRRAPARACGAAGTPRSTRACALRQAPILLARWPPCPRSAPAPWRPSLQRCRVEGTSAVVWAGSGLVLSRARWWRTATAARPLGPRFGGVTRSAACPTPTVARGE
jgi:hypothetical protein